MRVPNAGTRPGRIPPPPSPPPFPRIPPRPGVSGRGGFTLLEVLSVCFLIAILGSLAFPVVARTRVSVNQAACLSNQRQIGLAIRNFANDHDSRLPATTHTTGRAAIERSWIYELEAYLDNVDRVRICPSDPRKRQEQILQRKATSYVLNDLVFDRDDVRLFNLPSRTLLMFILSENRTPSGTWDHAHCAEWSSWAKALNDIEPDRHRAGGRASDRLKGAANYLYADGHVETLTAEAFKEQFAQGNPAEIPAR